ncbi:integrin beta-PS-like [Calliphora vicina]|uniref:integrin beta-PS-like n=1 Tax=Calliphora vicina TaxID=7373 RepID=UPI00325B18A4
MIPLIKLKAEAIFIAFVCCVYFVSSVEGQLPGKFVQNPCVSKRTCHECIQTKNCAWCMQPDNGNMSRCFPSNYTDICPKDFVWNPATMEKLTINRKLTLGGQSRSKEDKREDIVQISPQRVSLKLRINEVHSLRMRYSQAEDYPVDLYYLMDLSNSMADDKEKLSALGDLLSDTMRNITSNFRLGFGSFVDKVLMPYTSSSPKNLEEPCSGCAAPYVFKNVMSLSKDTFRFSTEVKNATISGNLDGPEGGLDALMQAVVCREQIGWRQQARRLLVLSTDNRAHFAGDGKLGGVIQPNDAECHLSSDGNYTHSVIQDYPSIAQINRVVKEHAINVIFAVTESHQSIYKKLSRNIEGSSTAILSEDSSNVVDLVKDEYNKISSSIEMKDNASRHVEITYHSACLNGGSEIPTSKCDGLKVGDVVNFTAQILVTSCPTDPAEWNQVIQIYPVGINETLIIDLEMLCTCPCEKPGSTGYQTDSPVCNNHGTLMCGSCECDDLHFGRKCECSAVDVYSKKGKNLGCRADNVTEIDCNGRGSCLCGVCECDKRSNPDEIISGSFCECDNFSCDRREQLLCSGPNHGVCECGSCVCKLGWTGAACDCRVSNETCIPPNDGKICSGNGVCECGACKCRATKDGRYSGQFCEKCSTCASRCLELRDCVQCQMYKTGPLKNISDCAANCTSFVTKGVVKVEIDDQKEENLCTVYDDNDCKFTFKYSEDNDDIVDVHAEINIECPSKVFILGLVLGIIGTMVLVGLATLLLWKLLTTMHDKREFEKERMDAKWNTGGNPLFTPATTTFENPTYSEK